MELFELGIKQAQEGLAKGEFSSVELTQAIIDRYHAKNGEIGAYLTFDEEGALALARENPKAVPIAIKDLINVKGQPCTCASKILKGYVSPYDATVIKNLKANGFIPAGRVNMDEFAMGSSTENSGLGVTKNPYDLTRVPGGSSGGSAAAVGGNLCIAALGTDTGGSIRQPASFCNCVGVKPSYGRVSRFGVTAFASSLDQVGPMTKSVEDAAILLKALAGHDEMDGTTPKDPVSDYAKALEGASMKGVKLGLAKEYLEVAGMDPEVKRRIIMGTYVLSSGYYDAYYGKAQKVRTLIKRDFDVAFEKVDALVTPCAPTPAFKFGANQDPLTMYLNDLYTIPSALAGVCASSVPAGFTKDTNLPVGVQFICGGFEEEKLLKVSKAFEEVSK